MMVWKIIFLLQRCILRFQPLIFWGVVIYIIVVCPSIHREHLAMCYRSKCQSQHHPAWWPEAIVSHLPGIHLLMKGDLFLPWNWMMPRDWFSIGWTNPLEKNYAQVKLDYFPKNRGEHKKMFETISQPFLGRLHASNARMFETSTYSSVWVWASFVFVNVSCSLISRSFFFRRFFVYLVHMKMLLLTQHAYCWMFGLSKVPTSCTCTWPAACFTSWKITLLWSTVTQHNIYTREIQHSPQKMMVANIKYFPFWEGLFSGVHLWAEKTSKSESWLRSNPKIFWNSLHF